MEKRNKQVPSWKKILSTSLIGLALFQSGYAFSVYDNYDRLYWLVLIVNSILIFGLAIINSFLIFRARIMLYPTLSIFASGLFLSLPLLLNDFGLITYKQEHALGPILIVIASANLILSIIYIWQKGKNEY